MNFPGFSGQNVMLKIGSGKFRKIPEGMAHISKLQPFCFGI